MGKNVNLKITGVCNLGENELKKVDGGTTSPAYDITDNYNGLVYSTKLAYPTLEKVVTFFAREILRYLI